jgi:oxygen-independent coproporphyrinogen III oxidase
VQIGMDHFALPGDELARALATRKLHRNFMGYTTKPATDSIAFGVSGIGDLQGAYIQNQKAQDKYYEAVRAGQLPVLRGVLLSPDDEIRRYVITQIMCNLHVDFADVQHRFGLDFPRYFAPELEALQAHERDGFLHRSDAGIEVTRIGRVFIRNIAMTFDQYLKDKKPEKTFSRTI